MQLDQFQREWRLFVCAYQFLTRIPAPKDFEYSDDLMHEAARYYALVGALVGLAGAAVFFVTFTWAPVSVCMILSTIVTLYLTGAFHEDGFADLCDGLGGGVTPERALEIMRDSRLGTYGSAGLILILALKISLLCALAELSETGLVVLGALIVGHSLSRASAVAVIVTSDYVRMEGTAKPVSAGISTEGKLVTGITVILMSLLGMLLINPFAVFGGILALVISHFFIRRTFEKRLGGYTGDCLGATQQVSEVGFYLGLIACI